MFNYNNIFKINENCEIKIEKVLDETILIIDNFYKYPDKIFELRKKSLLFKDYNSYYPGIRKFIYNNTEHLNELKNLLKKINFRTNFDVSSKESFRWPNKFMISEFVYSEKIPKAVSNPHSDFGSVESNIVAGVCYLSDVNHGGTGLYRNKLLNMHKDCVEFRNADMDLRYPNDDEFMNKTSDNFELLKLFEMKWNRLVMYDGNLFHAVYIEDKNIWKENKRITTNYFIPYK